MPAREGGPRGASESAPDWAGSSAGTVAGAQDRWQTLNVTRASWWPWVATAGALGLAAFGLVLMALAGEHASSWWETALFVAAFLISLGLGLLIAIRRPAHRMALPLFANAFVLAVLAVADGYASYAVLESPGALPGAEWAVLWNENAWPLLFAPVAAIALVFPDGHLPSRRWRPVAFGVVLTFALALAVVSLDGEPFPDPYQDVDNPLPEVPGIGWLWPPVMLGGIASFVAAVWAVRVRFRSAAGLERLQLKWLAYSSFLIPVTLLVCLGFALAGADIDDGGAFTLLVLLMLGAIPASVGIAVLRYRLYEIDRLINRTLVYGVLTVALAGIFAAASVLLGTALGSGSSWATAGATLLAAAAFRPLRARVQDAVDRRFSRARYDGLRRIGAFLEDLRAGRAAPEQIEPMLREILDDPALELRFWLPESEVYVDAHGREPSENPSEARQQTPVTRAGAPLGLVLHNPVDEERPGLLPEAVEAAGLAIEIVRLRVELRRQLEEVEASRARIVAAGDLERRRLERDLHDGAQQRLVSIGLALRHAQHELGSGSNGSVELLDEPVAEIGNAIQELRELARGVRPAQLDHGLEPALRELAARTPVAVEVEASSARFAPELEAAAYFIASEGVTNAVKHARASRVKVRAEPANGRLVVSVSDDGIGGASSAGSGLRGLSDRAEAHGGALRIESAEGQGTTLVAELPCGS
jgi:signal transduction histidine kinase